MSTEYTTLTYPACCTSAFCGRGECEGCPDLPTLTEFKAWVKANNAVCLDPIWCPTIYTPITTPTESPEGGDAS